MKTYVFPWRCDAARGNIELEITEAEVDLIKQAHRMHFDILEDCAYLDDIRERAVRKLSFYDPDLDQDIRISFPKEIIEE